MEVSIWSHTNTSPYQQVTFYVVAGLVILKLVISFWRCQGL
jgi:hypothetical protein